jgi:hypothetical protein
MLNVNRTMKYIAVITAAFLFCLQVLKSQTIVIKKEGFSRGFLIMKSLDGKIIADGEQTQTTRGNQVTTRAVFHFKDGSIQDETTVFSQHPHLALVSDHIIQRGPSFKESVDVFVSPGSGQVSGKSTDNDGKEKPISERMQLPADLANGIVVTLLKNLPLETTNISVPFVTPSSKPRLVKLEISLIGGDSFAVGGFSHRKAKHYVIKVKLSGVAGVVAPVVGKQPEDTHVWILEGEAPAFVRSEGPLYQGGPICRTEATAPRWTAAQ